MNERLIHLRIKVKTLVAESQIIRKEARKTKGMVKWGLNDHRKTIVREHTRTNLLAYGFLRGIQYRAMESKCREKPSFESITRVAKRFGGSRIAKDLEVWIADAKEHLDRDKKPDKAERCVALYKAKALSNAHC